jgi:hypothetical protein
VRTARWATETFDMTALIGFTGVEMYAAAGIAIDGRDGAVHLCVLRAVIKGVPSNINVAIK